MQDKIPLIIDHPPNSPDLNPIELIWKPMKDFIERENPQTKEDLEELLQEAWEAITLEIINNCILHFKKRMELVDQHEGEYI